MKESMGFDQILGFDREGNRIIITGENKVINLSDFEGMFGKVWNYDILFNHENATEMWRKLFNDWKKRGIID